MTLSQHISALIILLHEAKADADKFESGKWGSKAASVRLRKNFQIVSRELLGLRKTVIQIKKASIKNKSKG